jgi:hypothetical protein
MASAQTPEEEAPQASIQLHHGTDAPSANDLRRNGVNHQHAAVWNGSGEFWATIRHSRAEWFALSHPSSPPAACFEFDLPEWVLGMLFQMSPLAAIQHGPSDYELLPASHGLLNQHMVNQRVTPVP